LLVVVVLVGLGLDVVGDMRLFFFWNLSFLFRVSYSKPCPCDEPELFTREMEYTMTSYPHIYIYASALPQDPTPACPVFNL
jgi:hypothetical protein